ncbi:hypothetical protein AVEN_136086-1 [Araneus ventricosus]|uniref:Uncharacterized protein n=1 Tax=Araneus ventricosus TaxID=182803 RepID=A0A4Y2VQI5_ARAVE|nr:hypothetical protein AVEN_136086-1 [Araneus ventricosus]
MRMDGQADKLPLEGFRPKLDSNLQSLRLDHTPNFINVGFVPVTTRWSSYTYALTARCHGGQEVRVRVADYEGRSQKKGNADCVRWNVREDRILLNPSYCIGLVQPTLSPARLQLDCSENVDEEAVEQWINEDSTLECCEVLSDDDIAPRVTCGSEETRNFEECPASDEENLVTHQKSSHGDELVHSEALHNYLEQEDESTPAEKIILRDLRSIIRRRVNEKIKLLSFHSSRNSEAVANLGFGSGGGRGGHKNFVLS